MNKLIEENKQSKAKIISLENELKSSLKKAQLECKEKDNTIKVLKEQLKREDNDKTKLFSSNSLHCGRPGSQATLGDLIGKKVEK